MRLHNQQFGDQVLWREEPGEIIYIVGGWTNQVIFPGRGKNEHI